MDGTTAAVDAAAAAPASEAPVLPVRAIWAALGPDAANRILEVSLSCASRAAATVCGSE